MIIATYDIGTTAVKGVLVDESGKVFSDASEPVTTLFFDDRKEQNPEEWFRAFCKISRKFIQDSPTGSVDGIIMSGQMQDVIPVDRDGYAVGNAILYSDGRAKEEAEALIAQLGNEYLEKATGNHYDGSLSLPKIMWIKKWKPQIYEKTSCFLISAKDYVIGRLTGKMVGDITACSTAGAMNIQLHTWDEKILEAAGILKEKMPKLYESHQLAGMLTERGAEAAGLEIGTKVYIGVGDAGATTLASGISQPGEYNINLGTSGWVATVSTDVSSISGGVFNLAALEKHLYINVVPFLNAGNVHKWVSRIFSANQIDYSVIEEMAGNSPVGSNGIRFLPYLNGERFPVMDTEVRGTFLGITAETEKGDMIRSCLEGVAFSIRQGIESIGISPKKISVIGGGARVGLWNQILADILKQDVYVYKDSEVLPAMALSSAVLLGEGKIAGYEDFTKMLQGKEHSVVYHPIAENILFYERIYDKYLKIYPALKSYYGV